MSHDSPTVLPVLDSPPKSGIWVDGEDHFTDENAVDTPAPTEDRVDGEAV